MSYEDFMEEVKKNMMTRAVIGQEVARNINIPQKDIEAYYNAHKSEFVREEKVYLARNHGFDRW